MDPRIESATEVQEQVARAMAFLRRSLRFWGAPVVSVAVGTVACAAFLVVRKPMYRSETVILYSEGVRPTEDVERPDNARTVTVRLKEILMSRASLDTVAREFDLYPDVRATRGPLDAVEELRKHLEFRAPGGDTFSIAFSGTSPSEAQTVTSRLAELVIGQDSDLRRKQATITRDFLRRRSKRRKPVSGTPSSRWHRSWPRIRGSRSMRLRSGPEPPFAQVGRSCRRAREAKLAPANGARAARCLDLPRRRRSSADWRR